MTLADIVLCHAARRPERIALAGERPLTYGALAAAAARVANALADLGIAPGSVVGVQVPNGPDFLVLLLGLLRAGAVPILMVPALGARDVRHVLRTGEACAFLVDGAAQRGERLSTARALRRDLPGLRHLLVVNPPSALDAGEVDMLGLAAGEREDRGAARPATRVALFLLSGGTTGLPKLIPRTHRDYVYNVRRSAQLSGLDEASVYLAALPAAHNLPLGCPGILGALSAGGRVVMAARPHPGVVLPLIERERVTMTAAVPGVVMDWCDAIAAGAEHDLSSLRVLMVGGARLHPEQARRLLATFGCRLQQSYGMSEGFLCVTRLDDPEEVVVHTQGRPVSAADEFRLVGADDQDVAAGEPGELLVRGPYTVSGYHGDDRATRSAFSDQGFYRTGDLAFRHPTGNLVVTGRARETINRDGEKIWPAELEELLERHPAVAACAVLGVRDERLAERVAVCCVPRPGRSVELVGLRRFLSEGGVARYKLPERLLLLDSLPLTGVGKVDREALRARMAPGDEVLT